MNHFITDKATRQSWWEWPAIVFSGLMTAIGIYVVLSDGLYVNVSSPGRAGRDFTTTLIAQALFLGTLAWPLILTLRKRLRRKQALKLTRCLAKVTGSSITFGELGRRSGVRTPENKLQWMIARGWVQNIALDLEHVSVRLTGTDDSPAAPSEAAAQAAPEVARAVPVTGNNAFDALLCEIRDLNVRIDDRNVSDKIDRIEALTADIFQLIAEHPERADEIRRFVNYYLPTTFKLLESYSLMEKQRYQGESIRASRAQIEAVLDQIIVAIKRQQDKLFQSDALDVETDITVLKTMMSADGLTEGERLGI